jgi:hypothetical protein
VIESRFPGTLREALESRWEYRGTYPQSDQPVMLHDRFIREGFEVSDLPFDEHGALVPVGSYALWVRPGPS